MNTQSQSSTPTTPTTLRDLVVAKKCRRGPAIGTTKHGAFWLAHPADAAPRILGGGGDGIGQNGARIDGRLTLRQYRDGTVAAVVRIATWHQNDGDRVRYERVDEVLDCSTAEEVIVALLGHNGEMGHVISRWFADDLTDWLVDYGLPAAAPSPDDHTYGTRLLPPEG